jgi:glycerol-3-phosphate O-acyltransferase
MIQRLIYDPEVTQEIVNYAHEHKVPENVGFEKARSYAREIVPSFSAFTYFGLGTRMARMLAKSIYDVWTGPRNDEVIRAIPKDATIVFVMNHRSNMDYVLVTYLAAQTSALSYAVGEWAQVWPLSRLIRMMGAYFIRRRSRGALYRKVLARFVQMATAGGVAQGIFPEGGLSLTGKMMPPKLGLFSYLTEAQDTTKRDVVFVPVAINYDRVLEDRVLIAACQRGDRRFGARISVVLGFILRKFWQGVRGRYVRFGKAAVVFGDPLSLRDFGPDKPVEELAHTLMQRIEDAMPVLMVPLLARHFEVAQGALTGAAIIDAVARDTLRLGTHMPSLTPEELSNETDSALKRMERNRLIVRGEDGWRIAPGEEAVVAFYANSIAHRFQANTASAE